MRATSRRCCKMDDKYEVLRLKNQLCFPIYLCAKEIQRRYTPFLDKLNLTYTQYVVMMYFWEFGSSNVKALGKTLLLDPSTLTPLLKRLEAHGDVDRKRSEEDEREVIVSLTDKGRELREKAVSVPYCMAGCIGISPEDAVQLKALLEKLLSSF